MLQEYTSAKSCIKQVPAGFKIVHKYFGWQENTVNLDIGGGKYDLMTNRLKELGVTNLVFDPYNRSITHNIKVVNKIFGFLSTVLMPLIAALKLDTVNPTGPVAGSGILTFFFIILNNLF